MTLYCDLETFSSVDLKKCGTHAYAEKAEVLLFPYALDDDEVQCWDATTSAQPPEDLAAALQDQTVQTVWHNGGMFDLTVLNKVRPCGIGLPHSRVFDTMACAHAHSLPAALGLLGDVLGVKEDKAKHKTGKALIQLFCKPRPDGSRATAQTHPEKWREFIEYAKADITSMREVYKKLPKWNYTGEEYQLWLLDQEINQRGVAVDLELARGAVFAAEQAKASLAARSSEMTDGAVPSTTQRDVVLEYLLREHGVSLPDLQASTVERRLLDPDLPEEIKELLRVRLQASTTSVSKYQTLLRATSSDGRLRGLLQFSGAGRTGRWSGRLFQPQNLARQTMETDELDLATDAVKGHACDLVYDNVMEVLSNLVRGCLVAGEGRKLVVSDLANIEGRVAAWLAGEEWKLKAFIAYDAGTAPDLYCVAYGKSFNIPPDEVTKAQRAVGKVQELMLQYQGRVGAFVTGAATYRVDLDAMAEEVEKTAGRTAWETSAGFYKWCVEKKMPLYGLSEKTFIACDVLTCLWRTAHPMISSYWKELEEAFGNAVENPGNTFHTRKIAFRRQGGWLRAILPSGRSLCYPSPRKDAKGLSYMGVSQYTRKWERLQTYGGKIFENLCQAVARDVMAHAMPLAERAEYRIALTVHDELVTEPVDDSAFNVEGLSNILSTVPSWGGGLPLSAAGYESYRYRKG